MALNVSGKTALMTGGGSDISLEFTKLLLSHGCNVVITSSFKTLDINVTHPIRATQLAIDSFMRQKLGHGLVVIISSIAAQSAFLTALMYAASKHAMSGFTRSLADLEPKLNIRVNAVAPGCVKTPLWTQDKLTWVDEEVDMWVTAEKVAQVMLDLVQDPKNVGGTVLEVGVDKVRSVQELNDPGPQGRGHTLERLAVATTDVYGLIESQFVK
jgi:NAD(P)-dependent dehydrogenase (short-subunit alcohol dehydrogenase family)